MLLRDFIVLERDLEKFDSFEAILEFIMNTIYKGEAIILPKIVDGLREVEK